MKSYRSDGTCPAQVDGQIIDFISCAFQQVQISAYLDNVFDVQALMEDSETRTAALEKVADLEDELAHAHERIAALEYDALNRQMEMEQHINLIREERNDLAEIK